LNPLAGQIRLDFRAEEPIFLQIANQVQALVSQGALKAGDQLPTVRELAIDLRINFSTVARAYRILDKQRLISTQRGRGTYIWEQDGQTQAGEAAAAPGPEQELTALAQKFLYEALESGHTPQQIEQAFQHVLEDWKLNHATH
jgi:GntR family transcriptional regulator